MRTAARLAVAGFLVGAVLLVAPLPAGACTCVVHDLSAQARTATDVFIGRVRDTGAAATVFHVNRRYKGAVAGDVSIVVPGDGCAIPFTPGREYLVFTRASGGSLTTDLCAGTTDDLTVASQLAAAGLPTIPRADTPEVPRSHGAGSRALPIAIAGALAVTLGVATVVAARRVATPGVIRRAL